MRIAVVSPHDDDAVFSLAEHMLTWVQEDHDVLVVTVFGGVPDDEEGREKHETLAAEHAKAMDALGADKWRMPHLDDVYPPRPKLFDLVAQIRSVVHGYHVVLGPRGIHHPDHEFVAMAMRHVHFHTKYTYDEIPYYVLYPDQVRHSKPAPMPLRSQPEAKRELCEIYESQVRGGDIHRMLYVPERVRW